MPFPLVPSGVTVGIDQENGSSEGESGFEIGAFALPIFELFQHVGVEKRDAPKVYPQLVILVEKCFFANKGGGGGGGGLALLSLNDF